MKIIAENIPLEVAEGMPETALWRAVIAKTIQEWCSSARGPQRKAEQYLFGNNSDFPFVCEAAGIDLAR